MSGILITVILSLIFASIGSKSVRKMAQSMPEVDADSDVDNTSDEMDEAEEDYFSYETEGMEKPSMEVPQPRSQAKAQPKPAEAAVATEEQPAGIEFDLRQAVIYETILHNEYSDIR